MKIKISQIIIIVIILFILSNKFDDLIKFLYDKIGKISKSGDIKSDNKDEKDTSSKEDDNKKNQI
jgi:hypothetical protein